MINKKIAVLDLETTGFNAYDNEITEIGVILLDGKTGEEVGSFGTLLKIKADSIPDKVIQLTGITKELTEQYGMELEVAGAYLKELLKDAVVVAHNVVFDFEFLKVHFDIDPKYFWDTLSISRGINQELRVHKLEVLCEEYGISLDNAHRASDDARATSKLLVEMFKERPDATKGYINKISLGKYGIKYKPTHTQEVLP